MRQYIMELKQLSLFPDIVNQKTLEFLWVRSWTYFLISWTKSVYYKKYFLKVYIFLFMFKVITGQICFHLLFKKNWLREIQAYEISALFRTHLFPEPREEFLLGGNLGFTLYFTMLQKILRLFMSLRLFFKAYELSWEIFFGHLLQSNGNAEPVVWRCSVNMMFLKISQYSQRPAIY